MSTLGLDPTTIPTTVHLTAPALFDADAPVGSRRRLVLVMALFTTIVEIASIADLVPSVAVGSLDLPLSVIPALGLAIVCGERLLGRSTARPAAVGFWIAVLTTLAVTGVIYARTDRFGLWTGLLAASASEELVYRLAIPAVIAAVLRLGRVNNDTARIASLALAGLWFVLLPGHREQMDSLGGALPFVAFAALSAFIVYRSGSVLPMAAAHAASNLLTILVWREAVPSDARGTGLACVLGLLVLAYGRPRRLTIDDRGGLVDIRTGLEVTDIDLRDGQPPMVTLADGRILPVDVGAVRRGLARPAASATSRP